MNYVTLTPSYGRDYGSKREVLAAWEAGKDFTIVDVNHPYFGRQINKAQAERGTTYNVRYSRLTKVLPITVT